MTVKLGILVFVCCSVFLALIGKLIDAAGECQIEGKVYNQGDKFILDYPSCSSRWCNGPDRFICLKLCAPEVFPQCAPGTTAKIEDQLIPGTECSCKKFLGCV